jgi:uncharacterized protein (TIGR02145 family)
VSVVSFDNKPGRSLVPAIALVALLGLVNSCWGRVAAQEGPAPKAFTKRMEDGKQWTTRNLNIKTPGSYCYDGNDENCLRYGRLYTWESALRACPLLGDGWQLPTNDEWRQMATHYGGLREESKDLGKAAYVALTTGGSSGFNVLLGGGRQEDDQYARLEAHGFYWTSSESDGVNAWFYNFGKGGQSLNRHSDGSKQMALSVRCIESND